MICQWCKTRHILIKGVYICLNCDVSLEVRNAIVNRKDPIKQAAEDLKNPIKRAAENIRKLRDSTPEEK